ncbi:MAG: lytic transglycosylase domain-containing protein [Prevotella sp.]|nr:lytic transglycosylase domain-containing protein [Prevotella sp.]
MMRTLKIVLLTVFMFSIIPTVGSTSGPTLLTSELFENTESEEGMTEEASSSKRMDWNPVMEAIIQVESGGNPKAVNGNQVGAMQITPICVKECNLILEGRNNHKRFTLKDRYSIAKSKEMFLLIQSHRNPKNNVEIAIRAWNGGPRYSKRATQRYYERVMSEMK